jgi:NADH-quinone oxidoreductase subunit H
MPEPQFSITNLFAYLYDLLGYQLSLAGLPEPLVFVIQSLVTIVVVATVALLIPVFTIWLERKVAGRFQDRLGPNRVGPYGLLQSIADVVKLLGKEDITPAGADKVVYNLAPLISVVSVVAIWAVVPFGPTMVPADLSVGILYVIAVSGLGTIAIKMGGWSSNNKFALLGAFRTVAQLVSYEVPMIVALLIPVIIASGFGAAHPMSLQEIVIAQGRVWFIIAAPIAALLFFMTSVAEIGRAPFDLLEAESEIVAGFHIEYTGMKFGMWMLGEFLHAFTICVLTAVVFLGGWQGPFVNEAPVLGPIYVFAKSFAIYFVVIWVRSTLPRIRIDHLLSFNWKFLVPVSLAALVVTALVQKAMAELFPAWGEVGQAVALLIANALLLYAVVELIRRSAREARAQVEGEHGSGEQSSGEHEEHAAHAPAH